MNEDKNDAQFDDAGDPIASMLREQSKHAMLKPSSHLRERTLAALQETDSRAMRFKSAPQRRWMSALAAAAMLTLAVLVSRVFLPTNQTSVTPDQSPLAQGPTSKPGRIDPSRFMPATPDVRLAALTQPLQREAAALESDLRRISQHMRMSIPRFDAKPTPSSQPG